MRLKNLLTYSYLHYLIWKKNIPYYNISKSLSVKSGLRIYLGKRCQIFIIEKNVKINRNVDMEVGGSLSIGADSVIGVGSFIQADGEITIGSGVLIAPHVKIFSTSHAYGALGEIHLPLIKGHVNIGNNVWIGAGAVISLNVKIGNNAVIGANSFVNCDIPDNCVAAGIPARVIKRF